jgi:hypothetical protein
LAKDFLHTLKAYKQHWDENTSWSDQVEGLLANEPAYQMLTDIEEKKNLFATFIQQLKHKVATT